MADGPTLDAVLDRELAKEETAPAAAPPVADTPAQPAAPAPTETVAATDTSTAAPEATTPEPDMLPRSEVEKARREAHNLRERAKQYEEVFGTYSEEDRTTLLALARAIRDNPAEADAWWQQNITAAIAGQQGPAAQQQAEKVVAGLEAAGVTVPGADEDEPLTRAELKALLDERDRGAREKAAIDEVVKEAKALGYDLDGPEYVTLLWFASNRAGGDLQEAHRMMQEFRGSADTTKQAAVDEYVASKAKEPDSTLPGTATGPAPAGPPAIKSLKDADRALRSWLDETGATGSRGR